MDLALPVLNSLGRLNDDQLFEILGIAPKCDPENPEDILRGKIKYRRFLSRAVLRSLHRIYHDKTKLSLQNGLWTLEVLE